MLLGICATLVLGLSMIVQVYLARLSQRRHDALVEIMWLLRDNESSARGTSIQPHATQLRLTAEEICEEYRVDIVTLPDDKPL